MEKKIITDINGKTKKTACLACSIQNGEFKPLGGSILKSKYFDAHQDYEIPIPCFIIIASKRHLQSIDEFTQDEQEDFVKFLCSLRSAMKGVLDIKIVYLFQRESENGHFHIWFFPRYDWMNKKFGEKIQSVKPIIEYAKENFKTLEKIREIETATEKLKQFFKNIL